MGYIKAPQEAIFFIQSLWRYGHKAYFVGGCVRDAFLNKTPNDWDICTDATPEQVTFIANTLNEAEAYNEIYYEKQGLRYDRMFIKVIPTGIKHGTVTVMIDNVPYEVTTFRTDGDYSDGRRPDNVTFTKNIIDDLSRRDFTINAIAFNPIRAELEYEARVIDPYYGVDDINNKTIRCVGNPNERFNEDGLRILRAIRFAAQLGFTIEEETAKSIHENKHLLRNISRERIQSELFKILNSNYCGNDVLREYADIICVCIPEIEPMIGFEQNNPYHLYDVWEHTLHCMDYDFFKANSNIDIIVRLAVLFHDIGKPFVYTEDKNNIGHFYGHALVSWSISKCVLKELKCSNDIIENVTELIKFHDVEFNPTKASVKRLLNKLGEQQLRRLISLRIADIWGHKYNGDNFNKITRFNQVLEEVLEEESCFKLKDLAVNGNDLKIIGIPEGKIIGEILNELLLLVIDCEVLNEKEKLLEMAQMILEVRDSNTEGEHSCLN